MLGLSGQVNTWELGWEMGLQMPGWLPASVFPKGSCLLLCGLEGSCQLLMLGSKLPQAHSAGMRGESCRYHCYGSIPFS